MYIESLEIEEIFMLNKKIIKLISDVINVNDINDPQKSKSKKGNDKESFFTNWNNYIAQTNVIESETIFKK